MLVQPIRFAHPVQEAGDGKRVAKAASASSEILKDQSKAEQAAGKQTLNRLTLLKNSLRQRLLSDPGSLTDFQRFNLTALLTDVDRMIAQATADMATQAKAAYDQAATLGDSGATEPMIQLAVGHPGLPGLDRTLVDTAFGNTVDLLTLPMQQFATSVKVAVRRVALAGDNRFAEIQRLRTDILGKGFDQAQFKAERIVRTEVGRVFNQATYDRLVQLSQSFPFLRKGWRASKDNRTRQGHKLAGETYARGQGIPIPDRFVVKVYDERPGKGAKLIGIAFLRFPIDPDAQPEGRIAAAATIMCRCNAFVDIDLAAFQSFVRSRLTVGPPVTPPTPAPPAPPLPKPKPPKVVKPRVKKPKITIPKPADVLPVPEPSSGPTGTKISGALRIPASKGPVGAYDAARQAMAVIDRIHGDGNLAGIPFSVSSAQTFYGVYRSYPGRGGIEIQVSRIGAKSHPHLTIAHEVGHWLDQMAVSKGPGATPGTTTALSRVRKKLTQVQVPGNHQNIPGYSKIGEFASGDKTQVAMQRVMQAIDNTDAIQTMDRWLKWQPGKGENPPTYVSRKITAYYLSNKEKWARAYAQYIATKSQDPAMLRQLNEIRTPSPLNQVNYPSQWTDADFQPVLEAIDNLFKELGWTK